MTEPIERARAYAKLAHLSLDAITARQHLDRAVEAYRQALSRAPGGPGALELGRTLILRGDLIGARDAFTHYVQYHPDRPEGYLARAEVNLQRGDREALQRDGRALSQFGESYRQRVRCWIEDGGSAL